MRILIDQNISFRLIPKINHLFSEVEHVRSLGLTDAADITIFRQARLLNYDGILTLDEDFENIIIENSPPPKILWLRVRNCSTNHLAEIIVNKTEVIHGFLKEENVDYLEIFDV